MQITNVKLFKSNYASEGSTKAFGQLELANAISLDIEVREKANGERWVCFPGYKKVKDKVTQAEKFMSRVFITDEGLRKTINEEVIAKYDREIRGGAATPNSNVAPPVSNASTPFPF